MRWPGLSVSLSQSAAFLALPCRAVWLLASASSSAITLAFSSGVSSLPPGCCGGRFRSVLPDGGGGRGGRSASAVRAGRLRLRDQRDRRARGRPCRRRRHGCHGRRRATGRRQRRRRPDRPQGSSLPEKVSGQIRSSIARSRLPPVQGRWRPTWRRDAVTPPKAAPMLRFHGDQMVTQWTGIP